jgi:hypothetical protein
MSFILFFLALLALAFAVTPDGAPHVEYRTSSTNERVKRAANDVQHQVLRPLVHPELDQAALDHLTPGNSAPLFWSQNGAQGELTMNSPTIPSNRVNMHRYRLWLSASHSYSGCKIQFSRNRSGQLQVHLSSPLRAYEFVYSVQQ